MKKICILLVVLSAAFTMTSCNTFRGAGKDIERAGDAVQDATR